MKSLKIFKRIFKKYQLRQNQIHGSEKLKYQFFQEPANTPYMGKRILSWDPSPLLILTSIIGSISTALSLRGAEVEMISCGSPRDICMGATLDTGISEKEVRIWSKRCIKCYKKSTSELESFNIKALPIDSLVPIEVKAQLKKLANEIPLDELFAFEKGPVSLGRHVKSGVIRHYADIVLEDKWEEKIIREYFFTALITAHSAEVKINSFKPDAVFMIHGQYPSWGPAFDIASAKGIPVVRFESGYFPSLSRFRIHADGSQVSPRTVSESRWDQIKDQSLTEKENGILDTYLERRYTIGGTDNLIREKPRFNKKAVLKELRLNSDRPIWCIFPNVGWDAALQLTPKSYKNDREWIADTVKTVMNISEVQWIIKVHPGEFKRKTVYGIQKILNDHFSSLPDDLFIMPPDMNISTFDILNLVDGGVFYIGNTASLELAMLGKPVIMAGETISSKRGFTHDAYTREDYLKLLKRTPTLQPLDKKKTEMARRLAYEYFIKTQIPLRTMNIREKYWHSFNWANVDKLFSGGDPFIDLICDNFFNREDIRIPDELIDEAVQSWQKSLL